MEGEGTQYHTEWRYMLQRNLYFSLQYQYFNFTLMFHVFSGLEKPLFDLDPIE